jgi:oxygen-independent coproporphyrinogen-3 oxidase
MVSTIKTYLKNQLRKMLTSASTIALERSDPFLVNRFVDIDELGLYLHIPFCNQICPYCPYNKEIYHPNLAKRYANAVMREVDLYSKWVGDKPITSFYIGGGTPTTMLENGLETILDHIYQLFNMQCGIHLESHPNDLEAEKLEIIGSLGVEHLSIGVEALQDHHLKTLSRPYSVKQAKEAVSRAVNNGFTCVNADFIFALPGQTYNEVEAAGKSLIDLGVDQVATYPLFKFPYTKWHQISKEKGYGGFNIYQRRKMLAILEDIFYGADYERTSVWAFTKTGVPKYCSVTVPLYLGLGASGSSYLKDVFYLNTFNVGEYIKALEAGQMPIALSLELTTKMQMAGWLYWRIYETRFKKCDFLIRFGKDFDRVFGRYFKPLSLLGLVEENGDEIVLSDDGAYWLHAIQDVFSIDYISKLWGISKSNPWPERVIL